MTETTTIARSAWPTLPRDHNASEMILRHSHTSRMIFIDVSSIRLGPQVATLSEGLVPDLIPQYPSFLLYKDRPAVKVRTESEGGRSSLHYIVLRLKISGQDFFGRQISSHSSADLRT